MATPKTKTQAQTIVDIASGDRRFSTLVSALKAAGLVDTLKGNGPFTVFAPTNDAFEQLPEGTLDDLLKPKNKTRLQEILKHHVVQGRRMADAVSGRSSLSPMFGSGLSIRMKGDRVRIGESTIQQADLAASNGVVHVIDRVLMP